MATGSGCYEFLIEGCLGVILIDVDHRVFNLLETAAKELDFCKCSTYLSGRGLIYQLLSHVCFTVKFNKKQLCEIN